MTLRLLTALLLTILVSGCNLFSKKEARPKESSAIAADVEETFRRRWLERRISELTAQGAAAPVAQTQAENEFRERFGFGNRKN